jgi:hypothetical protein
MFDSLTPPATAWAVKAGIGLRSNRDAKTMPEEDGMGVRHVHYGNVEQLDLSELSRFAIAPVEKEVGVVKCYIKVPVSGHRKQFEMFLQDNDEKIMVGNRETPSCCCSYAVRYIVSAPSGDEIGDVCGKSMLLNQHNDFEIRAKSMDRDSNSGLVHYTETIETVCCCDTLSSFIPCANMCLAPRKMSLSMPPAHASQNVVRPRNSKHTHKMVNMPPVWSAACNSHILDFRGRVTNVSKNNFQLVERSMLDKSARVQFGLNHDEDDGDGKSSTFTLDYMWPFSPFQAFSLALTSLDRGTDMHG